MFADSSSSGPTVPSSPIASAGRRGVIGLVIPTRWEASPILKHFHFLRQRDRIYAATMGGRTVLAVISGMGRTAARIAAETLVDQGAQELVSVGFCGALVPELRAGDLVTQRIITVDQPARTPTERQKLTERAGAVAVDMETRAIVEVGTRHGVPIRMLRVICDEYSDNLAPLFGPRGRTSRDDHDAKIMEPAWMASRFSTVEKEPNRQASPEGSARGLCERRSLIGSSKSQKPRDSTALKVLSAWPARIDPKRC